jgi:hypothetical protein
MRNANRLFSFDYLGPIRDAEFLSDADYKTIEKALGSTDKTISTEEIRTMVSRKVAP